MTGFHIIIHGIILIFSKGTNIGCLKKCKDSVKRILNNISKRIHDKCISKVNHKITRLATKMGITPVYEMDED